MDIPQFPPVMNKVWASYVADRRPQFKLHSNRGQAMNAVMYQIYSGAPRGGVIYHLVDGEWQVDFTYEQDWTCVVCGELIENPHVNATRVNYRDPRDQARFAHRNRRGGDCYEQWQPK